MNKFLKTHISTQPAINIICSSYGPSLLYAYAKCTSSGCGMGLHEEMADPVNRATLRTIGTEMVESR